VKSRTEPCHIWQVLEVLAAARGEDSAQLARQVLRNSERVFFTPRPPE
jgi:TatD DNase family protein